jgi:hypothetical protein
MSSHIATPTRCLHVVRAFGDPMCAASEGDDRSRCAMRGWIEDEKLILAIAVVPGSGVSRNVWKKIS